MTSTNDVTLGQFGDYFKNDPHIGVWVLDRELRVLFATETADRLLLEGSDRSLEGLELTQFLPDHVANSLLVHVRQVLETGQPLTTRGVWRGRRLRCVYLPGDNETSNTITVVTRPEPGGSAQHGTDPSTNELIDSDFVELGRFAQLTPRELEVLAYFGLGYGIQDTAKQIHRAVTTVKRFREGLARKLNISDRCRLGQLARDYGLLPEHAGLLRVNFPATSPAGGSTKGHTS